MNDGFRAKAGKGPGPYPVRPVLEAAIRRRTAAAALQHPATLLPLAVCLAAISYLLLLSPMFGGGGGAAALAAICGAAAAASYLHRYAREYPKNAREMAARREAQRLSQEEAALEQYCNDLRSGFLAVDSAEGTKALAELMGAYGQLQAGLAEPRMTDPLSISPIASLAGETHRRGLSVLSDALELMKAARTQGKDSLEAEIARLETDLNAGKESGVAAERLKLKEQALASSRERLDMRNRLQLYIDQLLYQAYRCQGSLQAARIELASIRVGGSKTSVDSVLEALERTLNQVKEVQDELERLGQKG